MVCSRYACGSVLVHGNPRLNKLFALPRGRLFSNSTSLSLELFFLSYAICPFCILGISLGCTLLVASS